MVNWWLVNWGGGESDDVLINDQLDLTLKWKYKHSEFFVLQGCYNHSENQGRPADWITVLWGIYFEAVLPLFAFVGPQLKEFYKITKSMFAFIPSPRREGSFFLRSTGPLNRGFEFFTKLSTSGGVVRILTWRVFSTNMVWRKHQHRNNSHSNALWLSL